MIQPILYFLCLIIGSALTYFIFQSRLKKITDELNNRIDKIGNSNSSGSKGKLPDEKKSGGPLKELENLGTKIQSISDLKTDVKPQATVNAESQEKSDSLKQRFENLQVVNELGQRVTSSLNLEDTFKHLFDTLNFCSQIL